MRLCHRNVTRLHETVGPKPGDRACLRRGPKDQPRRGGGCQNARLAAVPETSPDRADSVVDRAAGTSESRDLALSVEQEIYLKDTPAGPIPISWHFEWLKEWQPNPLPPLTQPLYQRHRSVSIFSFLL